MSRFLRLCLILSHLQENVFKTFLHAIKNFNAGTILEKLEVNAVLRCIHNTLDMKKSQ